VSCKGSAARPSFGQDLAAVYTVLPVELLRLGAFYLAVRLISAFV
jgi:hypothetical protein